VATSVQSLLPADDGLDPSRVIEVETEVGALWLERDADVLTPSVLESGRWQPDMTDLVSRLLRPGMTVVDAGANVGFISVQASKLVGPTGRVYCIEADPANVSILRANLWRNGCTNARVLPVAAWFERADLNLTVVPDGGLFSQVTAERPQEPTVPAYRLDELVDGRVDYLKIDCEGTDHLVLRGSVGLFESNPDLVATVEFTPDHATHTGHTSQEILDIYREMGLKPSLVSVGGYLRPTSYERLASSGSDERVITFDFALSQGRRGRLLLSYYLLGLPRRIIERLLELGGDLLEHVPEPIRPKIRRRDRLRKRNSSAARLD
jgi:FkbM family methyltransferase